MRYEDLPLKVSKDSIKKNPARVGQAVYDIISKPQAAQTVEDTISEIEKSNVYYKELFKTIDDAKKIYDDPFYVVILRKKEFWALNVLRQWYISRQTRPHPKYLRETYPNHDHDVWKVNGLDVYLEWTLPTAKDSESILTHKDLYDPDLVKWITEYNQGRLS